MRVILSTFFFFCLAFSAQSQVLKSAGVWYFLDVDSLNNRPAQLPNGAELAYVVGTKKIYRWNRSLSIWEEYSSGGLTMPFDSITFNPTTADPDTAELKYNADLETFVFGADGTIIEIGQKTAWYVKNQTGSTITKGTVVRASGTLGSSGRILVSPMVIDGSVPSRFLLGVTASDIANGSDGYVIHFGKLRKFNTSSWADGTVLYAGTGGALTSTEPSPPNLRLPIAFVVHSHATNGVLAIRVQTGNELHELHDVDTTGIGTGEGLVWNSISAKWEASNGKLITVADTSAMLGNYIDGSGTTNRIPIFTAARTIGNSNIQDNNTVVSILNSKPFSLGQWTTAGRPTGVQGYLGYNTTTNGLDWYNGTRWATGLESTFARGTSTYVPVFDANGQIAQNYYFRFSGDILYIGEPNVRIRPVNSAGTQWLSIGTGTATTQGVNIWGSSVGSSGVVIGFNATALNNAVAIGSGTYAAQSGTSIGNGSVTEGINVAIGDLARANGTSGAIAIGRRTIAPANGFFVAGSGGNNSAQITEVFFGSGVQRNNTGGTTDGVGTSYTINGSGALGSNFAGGNVTIAGGKGTGTGTPGDVIFSTSALLGSGSTLQSLTQRWWIKGNNGWMGNTSSPTQELDVNGDAYIRDSLRIGTLPTLSTTPSLVGADASGWFGKITVGSGLSISSGTLSATAAADGNGIYTGSGTLSQHTTRALIPGTGNLYFSQKFNSNADSAFFNIVNYLGGERAVNFGLTDTSSTGFTRGFFYSDGGGSMNWTFETNDANGSTTVKALDGELSLTATAGNISVQAPVDQEFRVTGLVRAKQEAYYEINSTSSPQNLSNTYSDNFINQGSTQATFTLVFPASPEDGQILKITYNNNISSLTLDGNGNTIVGTTVTTAVEGSQRVFKFYAGEGVWIRQN